MSRTFENQQFINQIISNIDQAFGKSENQSFQENPIFETEQGRYLADTLADPLIKGLTQIASKRPDDPVAYLTNFLQSYMTTRSTQPQTNPATTTTTAAVHTDSSKTSSTAPMNSNASPVRRTHPYGGYPQDSVDEIEEDPLPNGPKTIETGAKAKTEADIGADTDSEMDGMDDRDEHGQSMLHFACARSHRRGGLLHLIQESHTDITYRDELYRTARDVSLQANQLANAKEIDRYVLSLAVIGELQPFERLALAGYDHILDVVDDNGTAIVDVAVSRGHEELADYLRNLRSMEELREELHQTIRENNVARVREITAASNAKWLLKAKNYYGRTALHIAVLKESEVMVEHFVNICPECLKIGDNLERTALHYAMGTDAIEGLSRILIQKGAKRTRRDLKGRQPSYYFMNKADVLRLQEEEDENR